MSKKIVVLNGSPRPKGNTAALIAAFTRGAEASGNTVTAFLLDKMDIHGCKSCFGGGKNPDSPCVQKDDMDKIYPAYQEADIVVLASPLYYWTISGQLKCAIDRLFAVAERYPGYQGPAKDCILLMAGGSNMFTETTQYYNGLLKYLGWRDLGQILVPDVIAINDIKDKPELEAARKLGASIK